MPRSSRPQRPSHVPLRSAAYTRSESDVDGEWTVRSVSGSAPGRTYRCPGCDQVISGGDPHLVVWPAAEYGSVEDRRHWHVPCWAARRNRRPQGRRR